MLNYGALKFGVSIVLSNEITKVYLMNWCNQLALNLSNYMFWRHRLSLVNKPQLLNLPKCIKVYKKKNSYWWLGACKFIGSLKLFNRHFWRMWMEILEPSV